MHRKRDPATFAAFPQHPPLIVTLSSSPIAELTHAMRIVSYLERHISPLLAELARSHGGAASGSEASPRASETSQHLGDDSKAQGSANAADLQPPREPADSATPPPALVRATQDASFGDYQVNGILPLAKRWKCPPRELAARILPQVGALPGVAEATVAGPGFINLHVDNAWVSEVLKAALNDAHVAAHSSPRPQQSATGNAATPQTSSTAPSYADPQAPAPTTAHPQAPAPAAPFTDESPRGGIGLEADDAPQRIVVDYSGPNIAKQMHVGHLRSTILGDALVRLLRATGHDVIGDNHLGDWGTQFGLLIVGMQEFGDASALHAHPMAELERVYAEASRRGKSDEAFASRARQALKMLQDGDAASRQAWSAFVEATMAHLHHMYDRLSVRFDTWKGESAYHEALPGVVHRLLETGIARTDDGAACIFFSEHKEAPERLRAMDTPMIVRKRDGAFLYGTTDLATLDAREEAGFTRAVYVVDSRQSLHFEQVFAVHAMQRLAQPHDAPRDNAQPHDVQPHDVQLHDVRPNGNKAIPTATRSGGRGLDPIHVGFGTILGKDGKPLRTRDGGVVSLASLLDEAEKAARARIEEQGLDIDEADIEHAARVIGIGAVKYADLRQNRMSDYRLDIDKFVAFQGNSGPYLQYAYARIQSIFRKAAAEAEAHQAEAHQAEEMSDAGRAESSSETERASGSGLMPGPVHPGPVNPTPFNLAQASIAQRCLEVAPRVEDEQERALAMCMLRYPDALHQAAETMQPHLLCDQLFATAKAFAAFYESCAVLKAPSPSIREGRLALCALAARQLAHGLGMLGIGVLDRM